jgi:hypothetical protein
MKVLTGILHVHSKFSYDGVSSVDELAAFGRACGYSFMAMSEHSDTFDRDRMAAYVDECRRVTGPDFVMIPGIEFTCESNLHVVGIGIQTYTDMREPVRVARFVREQGGVPVAAHPSRYHHRLPSGLADVLGGIEVWNASYDGRFVPNASALNLLKEFRQRNASINAFAGQDLHRLPGRRCRVTVGVHAERLDGDAIVRALARGDFSVSNGVFRLHACGEPGPLKLARIGAARIVYERAKYLRDGVAAWRAARAVRATSRGAA